MEHVLQCRSNWCGFVKDFGDAIGGFIFGYGVKESTPTGYIIFGAGLIFLSIILRFYPKITRKKQQITE